MAHLSGRGLVRRFPGTIAVNVVDIELAPGRAVGLVGSNGAGKTTLLDLLSGSQRPDEGRVLLDGADITRLAPCARARLGVARTDQRPAWFGGLTVLENVLVGAAAGRGGERGEARRRALEELTRVGLGPLADRPGTEASTAGRKLGELARVSFMNPTVVLLDEPSAGHDRDSLGVLVASVLRWVAAGAAALIVDHDRVLVRSLCPTVLHMHEGRVGPHEGGVSRVGPTEGGNKGV